MKKENGRYYIIEYDVEEPERFFENAFLIDCQKLVIKMEYPNHKSINKPIFYEVNQETEEKKLVSVQPVIRKNAGMFVARWSREDITKGQTFRIEW